nr:immunoglobulin heavy chain junction region [Macaca mulatta]MOW89964.1 immunoglobulin heavy chain junction region [Macaca mulatta]MOW91755.1 immunoglobulin heavy chain junction region [Macaca mulatta]
CTKGGDIVVVVSPPWDVFDVW